MAIPRGMTLSDYRARVQQSAPSKSSRRGSLASLQLDYGSVAEVRQIKQHDI